LFERFTDRARRVVVLAQEEARLLNHNYIGTEHILLGLIHEGEGVAAKALESLGISLEAVRSQVEEIIGQGGSSPSGHIPFTPRAKKVLELSLREALQLGHNYIGTEHILLGLIREGEGVAAQVLVKLGADLSRVRQQVIQLLSGYSGSGQGEKAGATTGQGSEQGAQSGSLVLDQFGRNLTQLAVGGQGGGDGQRRAHPLAARLDEVAGHLGQEVVVGLHRLGQARLDPLEVRGHAGQVGEGVPGHAATIGRNPGQPAADHRVLGTCQPPHESGKRRRAAPVVDLDGSTNPLGGRPDRPTCVGTGRR
jgi:hypothetical protein